MILSLIAAYALDDAGRRVIGLDNAIPWNFPLDWVRFKEHTRGCPIIMGRKTFESIGRVLPGRTSIILSGQSDYKVDGAYVFDNLEKAIEHAQSFHYEIFIIGGQSLYEETVGRATRLYLTSFKIEGIEGDTFFPDYDLDSFKLIHKEQFGVSGDLFRIMERKTFKTASKSVPSTSNLAVDPSVISAYNLASNMIGV